MMMMLQYDDKFDINHSLKYS